MNAKIKFSVLLLLVCELCLTGVNKWSLSIMCYHYVYFSCFAFVSCKICFKIMFVHIVYADVCE